MNKLVVTKDFTLFQDVRNNTLYKLELNKECPILLKSFMFSKILSGSSLYTDNKSIKWIAKKIRTFEEYKNHLKKENGTSKLRYENIILLLYYFSCQLKYLMDNHYGFIKIDTKKILVIDDNKFIYVSTNDLLEMKGTKLLINRPFELDDSSIISPELKEINEVPSYIHYKTILYSIGCLSILGLTNEYDFLRMDKNEQMKRIDELLGPIKDTKLYWTIKRTLDDDIKNRCLIII